MFDDGWCLLCLSGNLIMMTSMDTTVTEVMTEPWCNVTYVVSEYQDLTIKRNVTRHPLVTKVLVSQDHGG